MLNDITFVVIGRNESAHLPRTFSSVLKITDNIIFVDSNSSDNSIEIAKSFRIKKILKVTSSYGTAALSRSYGASRVKTKYIQFLDGDESIEEDWIKKGLVKLRDNPKIKGVHGYKKVFKKNDKDYHILSDKEDWQPDYLQGAFLIEREIYEKAGGMETRIFGEEERDLYVRVKALGYEIWYIHELMASHYDWKNKNLTHLMFGPSSYTIWVPLFKAISNSNFKSYFFVYRYLMPPLIIDLMCLYSINFGLIFFLIFGLIMQLLELVYCIKIKRKGYFLTWKAAILNLPRVIQVYLRKRTNSVESIASLKY